MCNKLASRHVRVGLADPSEVPHCDICENAPGMLVMISLKCFFRYTNWGSNLITSYPCSLLLL